MHGCAQKGNISIQMRCLTFATGIINYTREEWARSQTTRFSFTVSDSVMHEWECLIPILFLGPKERVQENLNTWPMGFGKKKQIFNMEWIHT